MNELSTRISENKVYILVIGVSLAMAIYHMTASQVLLLAPKAHINAHLGFGLLIIFLDRFTKAKRFMDKSVTALLSLFTVISIGYVAVLWPELENRAYFNTNMDLVIGIILVVLVLEATRRDFGWILPGLTLLVVLYPIVGQSLPEPFRCQTLDFDQAISNLSIGLQNGIYGIVLPTSANYIFLFVIFGALLQALGGTKFFMLLANLIAGKMQGGPGIMSIVSSALVGSITGSAAANVAITGSFTIPLMKKVGYKPEHAAAIEASASNGGQIMPPIMGIVAFGMAGITGIPYLKIITMAIIPALLYFWAAGLYVYFRGGQLKIKQENTEKTNIKALLFSLPSFVVPFIVILILLMKSYSIMYVAFWAIVSSVAVSYIKLHNRPGIKQIIEGLVKGARAGAGIAASAACVGLIMATVTMSGLGVKLSSGIMIWSGGYLLIALILIAAICVVMGMGGPSLTAYFIVSMFAAPALVKMGVGFEQAHFFTMYFAVFAFLTPPVAIVALIAAKLAGAPYIKTAIEATKAAIGGFIIPFMFIYCPVLLLQPQALIPAIFGITACIVCLFVLEVAFVGYYFINCNFVERMLATLAGLSLIVYLILQNYILFFTGIIFFVILTCIQLKKRQSSSFDYRSEQIGEKA
ncbi:MAG: TRAP transporter fused permease subunit [Desulfobacula sp.]|nr:TRAP transporter fused permease subunit [Desulfobacula sp.]